MKASTFMEVLTCFVIIVAAISVALSIPGAFAGDDGDLTRVITGPVVIAILLWSLIERPKS